MNLGVKERASGHRADMGKKCLAGEGTRPSTLVLQGPDLSAFQFRRERGSWAAKR